MKTIQIILCSLLLVQCQQSMESSLTTFNVHASSEDLKDLKISRYNFKLDSMIKLKLPKELSENVKHSIKFSFEEPALYAFKFGEKNDFKIAVEKSGIVNLTLGDSISIDSKIAKISNFDTEIQKLNIKHFAGMIEQFDKAIKENDQATIIKLEKKKDLVLNAFTEEMEYLVEIMGASALAFDALAYFDTTKNINFIREMHDQFQKDFPQSEMTKSLQRRIELASRLSIGNKAPSFDTQNILGSDFKLEDFSGKYLLIDFWASWCRPCRVENPKLVKIYNKFGNIEFEILQISIDKDITKWKESIKNDGLTMHQQILDSEMFIYKLYSLSTLPSNFLLNPKGNIIAKNLKANKLDSLLNRAINNEGITNSNASIQ